MSISEENTALNEIMKNAKPRRRVSIKESCDEPVCCGDDEQQEFGKLSQWTTGDGKRFLPAGHTKDILPPGVYEIHHSGNIGLYFEKIPVRTEGLIRFPQTNSERVLKEIDIFWSREKVFKDYALTYKRGIILWGPPGCHSKGTKILMYNGSIKNVEDVVVDDELMGPDSKLRKVNFLCRGIDKMYRITPTIGDSFVVNAHHVMYLERSRIGDKHLPETIEVMVKDYLGWTDNKKNSYKLTRKPVVYSDTHNELPLDPYFLGLWLGDGNTNWTCVTTADKIIVDYLDKYAKIFNLHLRGNKQSKNKSTTYYFVGDKFRDNKLLCLMREMNLIGNKHIPQIYLNASIEDRLSLLAGLIDTDGHYSNSCFENNGWKGSYEIIQKNENLAKQIVFLARSLGFRATCKQVKKGIKNIGFVGFYFRIYIGGDLHNVPVKLEDKKCNKSLANNKKKNVLRCGIKDVSLIGDDNFYGFNLSDDHLYLTEDFIVHENSGKTCTVNLIMKDVVVDRNGIVIKFTNPGLFIEGMRILREIQPTTPVVVLMEDIDSIIEHYEESPVLNILDGVESVQRVVFLATTNYPECLGPRIINRPSRFDKRFHIGYPNPESRMLYFKHLCGGKDLKIDLARWVKDTDKFSIAHLKELFVAVIIIGDDYDEALENLKLMKEDISSDKDSDKSFNIFNHHQNNSEY